MKRNPIILLTLLLSVTALFFEQLVRFFDLPLLAVIADVADYAVLGLLVTEITVDFLRARLKRAYFRQSVGSFAFAAVFIGLFVYTRFAASVSVESGLGSLPITVMIVRNVFLALRIFNRLRRLSTFIEEISTHPAQTILMSFLIVILAGTLLLMMPFTDSDGRGLRFIDALFTATSAVCVTGLIVVDTASAFTIYGKLIILTLIQIGGLGIMLLSYFMVFVLRRTVSIEDKLMISYMLSERDMTKLAKSLTNIIYTTLIIEGIGAIVLSYGIHRVTGSVGAQTVLQSIFHSISAFCNAGFSLYPDSLERFAAAPIVIVPIAILIVAGGISFAVITDLRKNLVGMVRRVFFRQRRRLERVSPNTRAVLTVSGLLLLAGLLSFYGLEYRNALGQHSSALQYLSSFFQSVTLRTAGFNTIPMWSLLPTTYIVMVLFMFIGGASGSTAGGIKVNTVAVMFSYLGATIRNRDTVVLFNHSIPTTTVTRAFLVLLFGISVVLAGTILLMLFEQAPVEHLFFEVVSAFGTVGLSAGVTPYLSTPGKAVIIVLMFFGRIGPLTILSAASGRARSVKIEHPRGDIAIG